MEMVSRWLHSYRHGPSFRGWTGAGILTFSLYFLYYNAASLLENGEKENDFSYPKIALKYNYNLPDGQTIGRSILQQSHSATSIG